MRLPAYELRRRLYIIFRGEEGLDYGGVSRGKLLMKVHKFKVYGRRVAAATQCSYLSVFY